MATNRPSSVPRPSIVKVRHSVATYRRTFAYNVVSCSRREITGWDFVVVSVLWSFAILHPWVQKWEYISMLHIIPNTISVSQIRENYIAVLAFKCIGALATACAVDFKNRKLTTYLVALLIYSMAPLSWILIGFLKIKNLSFLPPWFVASYFVTAPVTYILIFNQKPGALVSETRQIVALFEFATSLSTFILFMSIPGKNYSVHVLTIVWIGFLTLIIIYIMSLFYVKRYVTNDVITEPTVDKVVEGIRRESIIAVDKDNDETIQKNAKRFTIFVLFLLPILVITSFDVALTLIDNTVTREVENPNTIYKFISKLLFIPTIALLFSGAKGHYARLGDIIIIGIAHGFNIVVICLVVVRLSKNDVVVDTRKYGLESRLMFRIAQPRSSENASTPAVGAVVHIYNTVYKNISVYLETPFHESERAFSNYFELPVPIDGESKNFKLDVIPKISGKTTLTQNISVQKGKHYWILIIGEQNDLSKLIQVLDAEIISPTGPALVIVLNGIVGETIDGVEYPAQHNEHHLKFEGPSSKEYLLRKSDLALKIYQPAGIYVIIYRRTGTTQSLTYVTTRLKSYGLYSLVIAMVDGVPTMEMQTVSLYPDLPLEFNNLLPSNLSASPEPPEPSMSPEPSTSPELQPEPSKTTTSEVPLVETTTLPPLMLPTLFEPVSFQASLPSPSSMPPTSSMQTTSSMPPTSPSSSARPTTQPPRISRSLGNSSDPVMTSASVFTGFTQAATTVGYIHYFWAESHLRLRTTILASFIVVNEIVAQLTKKLMWDFGLKEACIFLVMNSFAGIIHVTLGVIYHRRARREQALQTLLEDDDENLDEPRNEDPSKTQMAPASR